MSVLKRRSRMISFRVSEDEYAGLKNLCINESARSVSDMARDAVHRLIHNRSFSQDHVGNEVQALQLRVDRLDQEVKRLVRVVEQQAATNNGGRRNGNADF